MRRQDLERFKSKLLHEKERLSGELKILHDENYEAAQQGADGTAGDSNFQDHVADQASMMFDRERDLSLEQNISDLLSQVDEALARIDKGTYGQCKRCKEPIDEARLNAVPYAELCIEDKKLEEGPQ